MRDRILAAALLLEQTLRRLPLSSELFPERPTRQSTLGTLVYAHASKLGRDGAIKFAVWVRNDLTHGLGESTEEDWEFASCEFSRAVEEILPLCDEGWRSVILGGCRGTRQADHANNTGQPSSDPSADTPAATAKPEPLGARLFRRQLHQDAPTAPAPQPSIRINELARELGLKAHEILEVLPSVGVTNKMTHSMSITEDVALHIRRLYGMVKKEK